MPLPFLSELKESSVSMPTSPIKRKTDEDKEESYDGLTGAMEELHQALMAKKYKEAAEIFRSCFELMDSEPHTEGEHV